MVITRNNCTHAEELGGEARYTMYLFVMVSIGTEETMVVGYTLNVLIVAQSKSAPPLPGRWRPTERPRTGRKDICRVCECVCVCVSE